jgi:hypothetical protein
LNISAESRTVPKLSAAREKTKKDRPEKTRKTKKDRPEKTRKTKEDRPEKNVANGRKSV